MAESDDIKFRKLTAADIDTVEQIINQAKAFMKAQGLDQWQDGYPNRESVEEDLRLEQGYVLTVGGQVAAYSAVIFGEEPAYTQITQGEFTNDSRDYVTTHRICVAEKFRGLGLTRRLFAEIFALGKSHGYKDFRVDTLAENLRMRHVFEREAFEERGLVVINGERIAFQREFD